MTRLCAGRCVTLAALLCVLALPARAQVASLGKGWVLDVGGSITSAPGEVVSGRSSIKGSYSGRDQYTTILQSDPTFIRFQPNATYTITARYRVLTGPGNFTI